MTTTIMTIPATNAVEITGFVMVTVDTAVVVTVLVTVEVTVLVTVETAVVVTVEVVVVVVVVVVAGVHGMWKYDATHFWMEGSGFGMPRYVANGLSLGLVHKLPLAIA